MPIMSARRTSKKNLFSEGISSRPTVGVPGMSFVYNLLRATLTIAVCALCLQSCRDTGAGRSYIPSGAGDDLAVVEAQNRHGSHVNVTITAQVLKTLPDDRQGIPHQRFLLRLSNGTTVLVAHNISLAPYLPIERGSVVTVTGEYIWNRKGGVIHYTHRSTSSRHPGGWIEVDGKRYQ